MNDRRGWTMFTLKIATLVASCAVSVARADEPSVPAVLEPWRAWVMENHPEQKCPPRFDNGSIRPCVWTSTLGLDLAKGGGRFVVDVDVFADADVTLPGGADQWPEDVRVGNTQAIVTRSGDRPRVRLAAGHYGITGTLRWSEPPDSILIPRQHGILHLTVDGGVVAQPLVNDERLWLGKGPAAAADLPNDSLTARVYRKLDDGVPMMLDTYIVLSVAGSHRVVTLGRAMPGGFEPVAIDSELPARLEPNGHLKVQVEPGEWQIQLTGRALGAPTTFRAAPETDNWPAEEIWGFKADRALRVVNVEGATPIDLSQTNAPFGDVRAYVVTHANELQLVEQFRGDPNPSPTDFSLARSIWLSFDGASYTVRDTLDGTIARPTRLSARFVPGRMTVDDTPQLITRLDDAEPGIELPSGKHQIVATSELPRADLDTAVGWNTDVAHLSGELHLPPGWRLLWTRGVDRAPTAWIASWTLWDIFLVVISVVLALRLLGRAAAAAFAVTLVLVYQEPEAPTFIWIVVLLLLAALRLGHGRLGQVARVAYFVVLAVTVLGVLTFAIDNFRMAIYPQLENHYEAPSQASFGRATGVLPASEPAPALSGHAVREVMATANRVTKPAPKQYESNTQVQTGPGVPTWQWHDEALIWDGPVTAIQPVALTLSPPWLTRGLHVIEPLLLLLLLAIVSAATLPATTPLPPWLKAMAGPAAALLLCVAGLGSPPPAHADIPGADLLGELERRLTKPPECLPACAAIERASVKLSADTLTVRLDIDAAANVAFPLPSTAAQWWPFEARDGDRPAVVSRDDAGHLSIALKEGVHTIELSGPVTHVDRFELPFPTPPGSVSLDLKGWHAYGEQEGHLRGGSLQFEREAATAGRTAASLAPEPIAPYFRLGRTFDFGLEWRIHTTLTRVAPESGSIPFAIPLVAGESLLDGSVRVVDGRVVGVLPPDQNEISWESAFANVDSFELKAPSIADWSEQWTLVPSNFWHVDFEGVPAGLVPMKLAADAAAGPRFQPLAGETLKVRLTRPAPVPGETITVERVDLTEEPGARARRSTLGLQLLSSQGGNFALGIARDAKIFSIAIDGQPQPIPSSGTTLPLPVSPGEQHAEVVWESPIATGAVLRTSAVELPGRAYNIALNLALPTDRWPLFVGGPLLGPATLYWGVMLVVIAAAWLISRIPTLPLTTLDGILLGFGMSLANLPSTILVAAWLLMLLARQRYSQPLQGVSVRSFQLIQVLLALTTIAAFIALAASVPMGLLGTPEMHIVGNGSSAYDYHWFQDQAQRELPSAFVISAPMWLYRVVMLAWSLWLAFAIMRWARWGWTAFTAGGTWKSRPARPPFAPTPS